MAGWEAELIVGKTRGWISLTLNQRLVKFAIWHRHRKPNIGFFQVSEGIDNRNGAKDLTCFTISWNSCVQRCYHSQAVTFKGTGSQHCFKPGRPPKRKANELPAMATKGHPSTTYMCTVCRFHHLILQHLASWIYLEPSNTNHHRRRTCKSLKKKTCGHASFFSVFFILMPITLPILQLIIIAFIAHSVRMVNLSWHRWQTSQSGWHSIRPETHIAGIGRVQTCGDWTEGMEGLCLLNGFDHTSGFIFLCWVSEYHPTGCVTLVFIISFGRFGRL